MKVIRTIVVLFATLLAFSSFSPTQAQVEEHQIFLPIIMNNYKVRSETVFVREETVQRVSRKVLDGWVIYDLWMGTVHNDSSQTKRNVTVEVLYYNSANQLIGHQSHYLSRIIPPDGETCFYFYIDSQISTGFTKASFRIVDFFDEVSKDYRSLSVENFSKREIDYFIPNERIFQYQGTIHNIYPENLSINIMTITGFDNFGRVAECVNGYYIGDYLYPDQYYSFTIDGRAAPETISHTIINVTGSVRSY